MGENRLEFGLGNIGSVQSESRWAQWVQHATNVEVNIHSLPWDAERAIAFKALLDRIREINPQIRVKGVSLLARDSVRTLTSVTAIAEHINQAVKIAEQFPGVEWVAFNEIGYRNPVSNLMSLSELAERTFTALREATDADLWIRDLAPSNDMAFWRDLIPIAQANHATGIELQCRVDIGQPAHYPSRIPIKNVLKQGRLFRAFKTQQLKQVITQAQSQGLKTGLVECTVFVGPTPKPKDYKVQARFYSDWVALARQTSSHITFWNWQDPSRKLTYWKHMDFPGLTQSDGTPRHPAIIEILVGDV